MYIPRLARLPLAFIAGAMGAGCAAVQDPLQEYPPPQVRFEGTLQVGTGAERKPVRAELRDWILPPGLNAARLDLPAGATVIIELHAGKLETLIGNRRETRAPGAIWRVVPGESIAFTTQDDSVAITTLALRTR